MKECWTRGSVPRVAFMLVSVIVAWVKGPGRFCSWMRGGVVLSCGRFQESFVSPKTVTNASLKVAALALGTVDGESVHVFPPS